MAFEIEGAKIGVVGLGLMGSSIAANFLIAGHDVVGLEPIKDALAKASDRMDHHLHACEELNLLSESKDFYRGKILVTEKYMDLESCDIVLESVLEDLTVKSEVIECIEAHVSDHCIIATNTSAIPISDLQRRMRRPARFLGLHWSEPAYASRYLEIICGEHTDLQIAQKIQDNGTNWGKEPILLRKDIRGFVTNRLMYAVYREGLQMLERGEADLASLDKAFRYDTGSWITIMGLFQRMDYLGIEHFAKLANRTFGRLSNTSETTDTMKKLVEEKGRGIYDQNGLYPYSKSEASAWQADFENFSADIHQLAKKWRAE